VSLLGIHFVYEFAEGASSAASQIQESDGLVHHYRPTMWAGDPNAPMQAVRDTHMHKYSSKIRRLVSGRMNLIRDTMMLASSD